MDKHKIHKARALYYNLFANFFVLPDGLKAYLELINRIKVLQKSALDENSNKALNNILTMLDESSNITLSQEYDDIFHSPISKNINLTASFYDEGVQSGKKRVQMIHFIAKTTIRRDEKNYHEYEDSIGFIFAFLSELCDMAANGKSEYEATIHCVFNEILNDFIDEVLMQIYTHENAKIYKELMVALNSFVEFERLFLGISKPIKKEEVAKKECKTEQISEEELLRRARNKELKKQGPKQNDESCEVDIHYDVETDI